MSKEKGMHCTHMHYSNIIPGFKPYTRQITEDKIINLVTTQLVQPRFSL